MKKNFIFSMVLVAAAATLSSCATIIHGTKQTVELASRPTGARLFIDGKDMGTTPQVLVLRRTGNREERLPGKRSFVVKLELAGYQPYETKLERKLDGDGDFFDSPSITALTKNSISVSVTMCPDPSWEKIGQMTKLSK